MQEFFTTTELLTRLGVDESLHRDPRFTSAVAHELIRLGYTQRIVTRGRIAGVPRSERCWSRNWQGHGNKTQTKKVNSEYQQLFDRELTKVKGALNGI